MPYSDGLHQTTCLGLSKRIHARRWGFLYPDAAGATLWEMVRFSAVILAAAFATSAPFQCTSNPDPNQALEDTPGEAVYRLAQEFQTSGDHEAWRRTLTYLIERYPSSRFAVQAKQDLENAGDTHDGASSPRAASQR